MEKYIYQKFLLNCDYDSIKYSSFSTYTGSLSDVQLLGENYPLFDLGESIIRKLPLSRLDRMIDNEDDWNRLITSLSTVDKLVIYDDGSTSYNNKIISDYRDATAHAYLYRLSSANLHTEILLYG